MAGENAAASAICSICYEDLKPVVENLQSISACGHVFHELCLQQWFEYCPATNKRNCPICKQKCHLKDPCRLYFQSSGNQIDLVGTEKVIEIEEDPVLLRGQVKRLEGKIHNLSSALEAKKKENLEFSEKLNEYKEQSKEEKVKRWEALQEISTTQHLLKLKSEECVQLTSQCAKLQDRTMALAKELAALKLVSDISLEEDDVLKLALLGNNAKTKDTIDTLVKSLVIRNRSYKELLAKCNHLGRGEARSSEKLEKALEKIDKLKKRVRELETATEERVNKALRDIKVSKSCSNRDVSEPAKESWVSFRMFPSDNTMMKISRPLDKLEKNDGFTNQESGVAGKGDSLFSKKDSVIEVDDDVENGEDNNVGEKCYSADNQKMKDITFNIRKEPMSPNSNGTLVLHYHQFRLHNVVVDHKIVQSSNAGGGGDIWLSNGTNQNVRRWSKQGERNIATQPQGVSVSGKDDLIAVGPDGKGGRIKVLRSKPQFSNGNGSSTGTGKRFKIGTKASGPLTQGCLQIEHFFGKPNR
ncbi:unnamed protein product [Cochlearia groenlandica]